MADGLMGVNFQPGQTQAQDGQARPYAGRGVQEAIKILSLRLPRVVGAQAAAPMPLLTSQGSGGNPRVDSVVNQVMKRMMPQPASAPAVPVLPSMPSQSSGSQSGPSFSGAAQPQYQPQYQPMPQGWPFNPSAPMPRVIVGGPLPPRRPGQPEMDGGGFPGGNYAPLPEFLAGDPLRQTPLPAPRVPEPLPSSPFANYRDHFDI